nr:uncharacterized protein LOC109153954 [Ipomoea batatas]
MALLRLIVVVAVALFLLGAWASQATAHTNHVNKATSNYVKISGGGRFSSNVNNAPANPKPEKKSQNLPRNSNNGGTQYTQFGDPTVNSYFPNTNFVDTTNKVVEKTTETMAEPPQLSGTCGVSTDVAMANLVFNSALFLFGAWASQAGADDNFPPERPLKPWRKQFGNDNSEDKSETAGTPEANSSPASPTKTTPPDQSSTPILESADRIKNRAETTDSIIQPLSQNCDADKEFMREWSPMVIGAVFFVLLQPGLIFQWPGNDRKFEFRSMKTNRKAMFTHTMIFIAIYAIIIAVSHALFLFGALASQAAGEEASNKAKSSSLKIIEENVKFSDYNMRPERPIKPAPRSYRSGNHNSGVETETETPAVSSSPTTTTTPPASVDYYSPPILESTPTNRAEMKTNAKPIIIFIAIYATIIALSHANKI